MTVISVETERTIEWASEFDKANFLSESSEFRACLNLISISYTGCINTDCRFCIWYWSKVGLISRFSLWWSLTLDMRKWFDNVTLKQICKVLNYQRQSCILFTTFLRYPNFSKSFHFNILLKFFILLYHQLCTINFQCSLRQYQMFW